MGRLALARIAVRPPLVALAARLPWMPRPPPAGPVRRVRAAAASPVRRREPVSVTRVVTRVRECRVPRARRAPVPVRCGIGLRAIRHRFAKRDSRDWDWMPCADRIGIAPHTLAVCGLGTHAARPERLTLY